MGFTSLPVLLHISKTALLAQEKLTLPFDVHPQLTYFITVRPRLAACMLSLCGL